MWNKGTTQPLSVMWKLNSFYRNKCGVFQENENSSTSRTSYTTIEYFALCNYRGIYSDTIIDQISQKLDRDYVSING